MTDRHTAGGVTYKTVDPSYFEKRGLRRYAKVWSLWALGVGAVISGHYSGWNLGLANGFGAMLIALFIIAAMYWGLIFSLAEMSPALPHTGAAYSFARSAMGPWGGMVTGLAESIEYILTPAVIVFFIGSYLGTIFETGPQFQPIWWAASYVVFLFLNLRGVELSFRVSVIVTLGALAVLAVYWVSAIPHFDLNRWALNIGVGPDGAKVELPEGGGSWLPFGMLRRARSVALRGVVVPRDRAVAARGGGIVRPEERHAEGTHLRHGDADGLGAADHVPEFQHRLGRRGQDARRLLALRFRRAAARRLPRHLRHGSCEAAGVSGGDRAHRELPHHHLRLRQADLLAVAGRVLPGLHVDHASAEESPAHGALHGHRAGLRHDAGGVVHRRRREGRIGDRRHAAQHGGVRRDDLVCDAGAVVHPVAQADAGHRAAVSEPARYSGRGGDDRRRAGDAVLPVAGSGVSRRRVRGRGLLCARVVVLRLVRTESPDPVA